MTKVRLNKDDKFEFYHDWWAYGWISFNEVKEKYPHTVHDIESFLIYYIVMKHEDKQLSLIDLSARLPHGVIVEIISYGNETSGHWFGKLSYKDLDYFAHDVAYKSIRPFLRPMSSMTEEEKREFESFGWRVDELDKNYPWVHTRKIENILLGLNWLNANHFDYRGLIPKGLAIEVTEDNNPYRN